MNTTQWSGKVTDPLLNLRNCQALSGLYGTYPIGNIRDYNPGALETNDHVSFRPLDAICPASVWAYTTGKLAVWIGGTSGSIHIGALLRGWTNTLDDWQANRGASGAFADAARQLITEINPSVVGQAEEIYLFGHSYGGAVAQALAALAYGSTQPRIRIWSYGAPRPGLFRLGTILQSVTNTRFFTDDDPVRFIPPHSSEVPALTALDQVPLIIGCNQQVQCPIGWELQSDGRIVETEGPSTVLHAVATSIASWCADIQGFRSVNHELGNYIRRFTSAVNSLNPVIDTSGETIREREEVLTIRERERIADVGMVDINNALDVNPNFNTEFAVPQAIPNSVLRYKSRRVGRVWGVKYGADVVAIGPKKKQAKKLARAFNKAAMANW